MSDDEKLEVGFGTGDCITCKLIEGFKKAPELSREELVAHTAATLLLVTSEVVPAQVIVKALCEKHRNWEHHAETVVVGRA